MAFLCGCAGHAAHTLEARRALDAHQPERALELYNEALDVTSGEELPADVTGDNALLMLDRSTILQALEQYDASSKNLQVADKQIEMLDFSRSTAHEIGRYLFSDDVGPYKARPYEKLFVNTLNMANYLASGNLHGAKIEARRLAVMQKYLSQVEDDPAQALLGPGSYLAGFVFEKAGDADEAVRYYDEALRFSAYPSLDGVMATLASRTGYRSPRIQEILSRAPGSIAGDQSGEILVIVSYGRVPALKAERVPIGLALTLAAMYIGPEQQRAARRMAAQGLVTWVNYPSLESGPMSYARPTVSIDGSAVALDAVTNVDAFVREAYARAKGQLVASAITRMVARGAVGAGLGAGAAKASDSGAVGMLLAIGAQVALTAADTPDTRSWATLPAEIALVRKRVPAGTHAVRISAQGTVKEHTVEVAPSGFVVVNLTELSRH